MLVESPQKLKDIAKRLKKEFENGTAPDPERLTGRQLLSWFGFQRRGHRHLSHIRNALNQHDLRCVPDLEVVWVDDEIMIELDPAAIDGAAASEERVDPTIRISAISAANDPLVSVQPDNPLSVATTLMQMNDFSQLPVMQTEFEAKGIISWESIGSRLSLGNACQYVRDCMSPDVRIVESETPLVTAIGDISKYGYVLVKRQGRISGIVTSTDVVEQFMELVGPFLHIGEIEAHLRSLVHRKFTPGDMEDALSTSGSGGPRLEEGPEGLTLGDYCQLLGREELWEKLKLKVDRKVFGKQLDEVREMRNEVMHFRPEGLDSGEAKKLGNFAKFLRNLRDEHR